MPTPQAPKHLRRSDLRATAQLLTQATRQVAQVVEGVHRSVLDRIGLPGGATPGRTRGITGLVYRSIDGVAALVGQGADSLLAQTERWLPPAPDGPDARFLPSQWLFRTCENGPAIALEPAHGPTAPAAAQ